MAAERKAKAAKLDSEHMKMVASYGNKLTEALMARSHFAFIEDHCVDVDHQKCIQEHDSVKMKLIEIERRRFREVQNMSKKCAKLIHHTASWLDTLPYNSDEQVKKAEAFITCIHPIVDNINGITTEEIALVKKATADLRRMSNAPDLR